MNEEIKRDWITALRSARYRQGSAALLNEDGTMCCLGVLCDRLDPQGWSFANDGMVYGHRLGNGSTGNAHLKDAARDNIGLDMRLEERLMSMNDGGKSFAVIASVIEEEA